MVFHADRPGLTGQAPPIDSRFVGALAPCIAEKARPRSIFGAMDELKFDEAGLLPAVVQDRLTGEVRMVAYMNREALARTIETGRATFFSRSRRALWEKGETSGHVLHVREIFVDCDADTLLLLVDPVGPSCHTGQPTCFFRRLDGGMVRDQVVDGTVFLLRLEREIESRKASTAEKSYTK